MKAKRAPSPEARVKLAGLHKGAESHRGFDSPLRHKEVFGLPLVSPMRQSGIRQARRLFRAPIGKKLLIIGSEYHW